MATYDFLVPMFFSQYISYKHSLIYYYITVENYVNSNKKNHRNRLELSAHIFSGVDKGKCVQTIIRHKNYLKNGNYNSSKTMLVQFTEFSVCCSFIKYNYL